MFARLFPRRLVLTLLLIPAAAIAGPSLPVVVERPWVRAVPGSVTDTAAFMVLRNTGSEPLRLTGGSTPIAGMAMPMGTTRTTINGVEVFGMKSIDFIEVPPHGEHLLKPGGDHLMIMNLTAHPRPGEPVTLTLDFEPGHRTLTLKIPAQVDGP